jgi:methylmalonyl-CoA mutase N-terminal domain/subunit
MYARLMRRHFKASDASCKMRFHTQTGGVTLQAQQPLNNVVRVTVQALAAVLGGTQSLHTNGYDEALALPTTEAATLALRTQQIVAHESGAALTADPLAGSYYVEHLTDELERRAFDLMGKVEELGGAARAIEAGFLQEEIGRSAYELQMRIESGDVKLVGVNAFTDESEIPVIPRPNFAQLEKGQVDRLKKAKKKRDAKAVDAALGAIKAAAPGYLVGGSSAREALMPLIIDAVRARASVGEISDTLASVWGMHRPT